MNGLGCACGNPCDHGFRGVTGPLVRSFGALAPEGVDPWDTSRWTITEWAAAAGFMLSIVWTYNLLTKK